MAHVALVVDDSMLIRHTIRRFLETRGFRVECAGNGRQALALLANCEPELIVTDLQMPEMDGCEFLTALQADRETAAIPVVVVAAQRCSCPQLDTFAQFVITKDIDIEEQLQRAIDTVVHHQQVGS